MQRPDIRDLVSEIKSDNKEQFLSVLRDLVETDIGGRSSLDCLRVVTTSSSGRSVIWGHVDGSPYIWRLWAFIRNEPYAEGGNRYNVDSVLTAPILEIVSLGVTELITSYEDDIAQVIVTEAMINERVRDSFLQVLLKDQLVHAAGSKIRSAIMSHILPSIQDRVSDLGVHVATGATTLVAKVAATGAGKIILQQLSYQIAHNLVPIIAKLLAKPAVAAMLKKLIGAAIIASITKIAAAKIGSAAISAAIFPVIIGWLIIDVAGFPRKLGTGVAASLCENLNATFDSTMQEILSTVVAEFIEQGVIQNLAGQLAKNPVVLKEVDKLLVTIG